MPLIKTTILLCVLIAEISLSARVYAKETISVGILAFRPKPIVEARWQPLINYLNQTIDATEFKFYPMNYTELEQAIENQKIDFVFTNSSHFVQLAYRTKLSSPLATLINIKNGQPVRSFAGTILVKKDNRRINHLQDLTGKTIATPSTKSFGGFKMQAYELYQHGIKLPNDAKIIQTTMPHDKSIQAVIEGKADVAFVRSGVLESMIKQKKIGAEDLKVLNAQADTHFPFMASTRLYPEWPFAAMPHVSEALAGKVAGALLALPHNGMVSEAVNIQGFRIPDDYEPVREVLRTLRTYPFDSTPEVRLSDIWEKRRMEVISISSLIAIILILSVFIIRMNHRLRESHDALKENNEYLKIAAVAFDTQEAIFITDKKQQIIKVNNAFTRITGYSAEESIGQQPSILKSDKHDDLFYREMWSKLHELGYWQGEIWNRRKNGEVFPVGQTISVIKDEAGHITHYVSTFDDITAFKENEERIKKLAFYDPLTGLANRRLLQDHMKLAKAHSARNHDFFALLFIDLDHFKTLNDTLGHKVGDNLLVQVASRLANAVREGDTVARLGGDEFVLLIEELDHNYEKASAQAKEVGEKVLQRLSAPYNIEGNQYPISASIGISIYTDHEETVDEMMVRSDLAMYQAKSAGRNAVRFFDPSMQETMQKRSQMEQDLRTALEEHQFQLYYQPKVDQQQAIIGYEALIRWQHPSRGLLLPDTFIPIAEDSGLINQIGQWVLNEACQQLQVWQQNADTEHLNVSVNISEHQVSRDDFIESIHRALKASRCNPKGLQLEITESLLMKDLESVIAKMTEIKALGITFAIDDFGTGYSSLNYLKQLPIDYLKIDKSFVTDMLSDSNDEAIVKTVLALSKTLGLVAIAEGVETEDQLDYLQTLGCPIFQGYLFGDPKSST